MIQTSLFPEQKRTDRRKRKICGLPKGKGGKDELGVWDEQIYTTVYKINTRDQGAAQRTMPSIFSCNGKESEREYMCTYAHTYIHINTHMCVYIYIYVYIYTHTHFAVHLKLAQYCKSTILQFKKLKSKSYFNLI